MLRISSKRYLVFYDSSHAFGTRELQGYDNLFCKYQFFKIFIN
jgi:hypothetical protein